MIRRLRLLERRLKNMPACPPGLLTLAEWRDFIAGRLPLAEVWRRAPLQAERMAARRQAAEETLSAED